MQCTFYFQFLSLTTSTNRNPRGITFSDASRDLLLLMWSNVKSSVFTFHLSVFSFLIVGLVQKIVIRIFLHMQFAHLLVDDFL